MKYKKCPRCELNYMTLQQKYCTVCLAEMQGKKDDFDPIAMDTCPFCEKNPLKNGEDMCAVCRHKRVKSQSFDEI
ncbi:MAG: hypothetical protein IJV77_07685 [Clostridia bacterium]|nr:hypothetical protein [Clostridia bacterium]